MRPTILTVLAVALLAVALPAAASHLSFSTPDIYPVGGTLPESIGHADIDGDGDSDLVTASNGSNNVTTFLNDGTGTYTLGLTYAVGDSPKDLVIADVNGDSDPDVITANSASQDISVLLGDKAATGIAATNGPTFLPASHYGVSADAHAVATGDFDSDGTIDVATGDRPTPDSGKLSVLTGDGTGAFALAHTQTLAAGPAGLAAGNLDGDSNTDLVVGHAYAETPVWGLTGNGDATFTVADKNDVGSESISGPVGVSLADLDGDSHLDVVTANLFSDEVSVLAGNGDGTLASATDYSLGDIHPRGVALGHVNDDDGDGAVGDADDHLDVAAANGGRDKVQVLTGNNDSTLDAPEGFFTSTDPTDSDSDGDEPFGVVAVDIDGDGDDDLATPNRSSDDMSVLTNTTQ